MKTLKLTTLDLILDLLVELPLDEKLGAIKTPDLKIIQEGENTMDKAYGPALDGRRLHLFSIDTFAVGNLDL